MITKLFSNIQVAFDILFIVIPWFFGIATILVMLWHLFIHWLWKELLEQKLITGKEHELKIGNVNVEDWIKQYHVVVGNRMKDTSYSYYIDGINVSKIFSEIELLDTFLYEEIMYKRSTYESNKKVIAIIVYEANFESEKDATEEEIKQAIERILPKPKPYGGCNTTLGEYSVSINFKEIK